MYINAQLSNNVIANTQIINLNKKMFVKRYNVRKSQHFNFDLLNYKVEKIL